MSKLTPENILGKLYKATEKSTIFNCLNHGDAWTNNMMFLYDKEGKIVDMKIVDFQMIIHSSPVLDLYYFLSVSPQYEVLKENVDTLLDYYYAQLLVAFAKLKYPLEKVPTRKIFLEEFINHSFFGKSIIHVVLYNFYMYRVFPAVTGNRQTYTM